MKEAPCEDCKTWEEELYWTHFQHISFTQFLRPGFDQILAIPEKFTRNLRRKLPDRVTLRGPGSNTREVRLKAHENTLFFHQGWREFVEDHSLEENDMIVFKYNGESCFDVLIFDGQSMCEKVGSYFVSKCVHKEHKTNGIQAKRTRESSAEVLSTSRGDVNEGFERESSKYCSVDASKGFDREVSKHPNGDASEGFEKEISKRRNVCTGSGSRPPIISNVCGEKARSVFKFQTSVGNAKTSPIEACACAKDVETKGNIVHSPLCLTHRRGIPEEHKLNALEMAQKVVTNEGFLVVMKPTHISGKYHMSVPQAWICKHVSYKGNQNMILRIKDKTWQIRFESRQNPSRGGFAYGWKKFVLDNSIKEFDVCVFEPGIPLDNTMIIDATIFHVVQEASSNAAAAQDTMQMQEGISQNTMQMEEAISQDTVQVQEGISQDTVQVQKGISQETMQVQETEASTQDTMKMQDIEAFNEDTKCNTLYER